MLSLALMVVRAAHALPVGAPKPGVSAPPGASSQAAPLAPATDPEPSFEGHLAVGLEGGRGVEIFGMARVLAHLDWGHRWFDDGLWYLAGQWEFDASAWRSLYDPTDHTQMYEFGITPALRYLRRSDTRVRQEPYLEVGVGVHWLTESSIGGRQFSTPFQFGDHVGAGLLFGPDERYEFGYRWQHFSNAGIEVPNDGIAFHLVHFAYRF